jgi:hypothetical protein
MNLAIFGWYHHRNAGDDRMQACLTRWLDGHTLAFLPAGRPPCVELLRTYDAALLGGGSIVNPQGGLFRDLCRWVRKAGIPVGIVGVTLDTITPAFRAEFRRFLDLDLCAFAWFRDQGSLDLVGAHPKAFAAPDLTWLYPIADIGHKEAQEPQDTGSGTVPDSQLSAPGSQPFPIAVCLRKRRDLPVAPWRAFLSELAAAGHALLPWPLYFEGGGDADALRQCLPPEQGAGSQEQGVQAGGAPPLSPRRPPPPASRSPLHAPCSPPEEFTLAPLAHAGAVISERFHGVLFALQAGLPVLPLGDAPKLTRFLAENDLPPACTPATVAAAWREFLPRRTELAGQARRLGPELRAAAATAAVRALRDLTAASAAAGRNRGQLRGWLRRGRAALSS